MIRTSITVNFFKALMRFFRAGLSGSCFAYLFKKAGILFGKIANLISMSVFFRFFCGISDSVAECYKASVLHKKLTSEALEKHSESSLFYRLFGAVVNGVTNLATRIICVFKRYSSYSLVIGKPMSLLNKTVLSDEKRQNLYVGFFGVLIAVMFCIPHTKWNNLFGLIIAFVAVAWVIYGYATKKENVCIRADKTYLSLLVFFASITLSVVVSNDMADSIRIYMFFLTSLLLCLSISMFASKRRVFRSICVMLFACVVITGAIGVVQAILKIEADASLTDLTLNANMPGRVFSTMGNPNNFAQMLVLFLPFCAAFVLSVKNKAKKVVLLAFLIIPFVALLQTYSRSGWIAFAVAVMVFVALSNRRAVPFVILFAILAIPFLPEAVLNRILTIGNLEDSSSSYRLVIWEGAFEMLAGCWVTGVGIGPGAFKAIFPQYALGSTAEVAHCHMQFLEVFLETGIIGFVSFIWMTLTIIKRSFMATSSKNKEIKYYAAAAAASMTSIIFIGFFEYYWFYPRVMFAFFVCAGLAISVYRMWQDEKEAGKE